MTTSIRKPRDLFRAYFEETCTPGKYVCKLCYPNWHIASNDVVSTHCKARSGYTFVTQHINLKHPLALQTDEMGSHTEKIEICIIAVDDIWIDLFLYFFVIDATWIN